MDESEKRYLKRTYEVQRPKPEGGFVNVPVPAHEVRPWDPAWHRLPHPKR